MVYIYVILFKFFNGESYSVKIRWARNKAKNTRAKKKCFLKRLLSFIYFPLFNQGSCMYTKKITYDRSIYIERLYLARHDSQIEKEIDKKLNK